MHLFHYVIKEAQPHSENSTTSWLPTMGLRSLSTHLRKRGEMSPSPPVNGSETALLNLLPHPRLSKLLGLNAHVSVPYYQSFNIQEMA